MTDAGNIAGVPESRFFLFIGVCGAGKSTVAKAFADTVGGAFIEADTLHSRENVKAMAIGQPLDDAQRWPWLEAVCAYALYGHDAARSVAIACSALKKSYRDFVRTLLPNPVFFHLHGPVDVIRDRLSGRAGHFMPPKMLESQLATLEPPVDEAGCYALDILQSRDAIVMQAIEIARRHGIARVEEGVMRKTN